MNVIIWLMWVVLVDDYSYFGDIKFMWFDISGY